MLIAYHGEKKPWGIKAVSIFVLVTFWFTQSDVRLATANLAAPTLTPALPASDLGKKDKIHYMKDLGQDKQDLQSQTNQNPLSVVSPGQNQQNQKKPRPLTNN